MKKRNKLVVVLLTCCETVSMLAGCGKKTNDQNSSEPVKQEELKETLFVEVKQKAQAFMETPEYMDYLCKQIQEVKSFAGEDEIQISLSSGDSSKLEALSQKTGAELTVSSDDFIGGIRAAIPQKNIMIDNSFLEGLESMRKEFKFDGGLKNE